MSTEVPPPARNAPEPPGLPPVTPPSGRFILQLFLVPGLIVLVAVLLLLAFRNAIGPGYTPDSFLRQLDSDNADIRWRGASDLAQTLKRPESQALKSDAKFALDLAQRLQDSLDDLNLVEKATAEKVAKLPAEEKDREWRKLAAQRNNVRFLAAALGDFLVPIGVPLLAEMIENDHSPDFKGNTLRRRQAAWALGNLGENIKGFGKLAADKQKGILDALAAELEGKDERRASWARNGLFYLDKSKLPGGSRGGIVRVDEVLAPAPRWDDRYLREQVALVLNFWEGHLADKTLLVNTLVELSKDQGQGTLVRIPEQD